MGEGGWENLSTNKSYNMSQLVMVPGNNELYHSREFPHKVCKNNIHVTLSLVRLKISHAHWNISKRCSASSKVFPKNVKFFSIEILGI